MRSSNKFYHVLVASDKCHHKEYDRTYKGNHKGSMLDITWPKIMKSYRYLLSKYGTAKLVVTCNGEVVYQRPLPAPVVDQCEVKGCNGHGTNKYQHIKLCNKHHQEYDSVVGYEQAVQDSVRAYQEGVL